MFTELGPSEGGEAEVVSLCVQIIHKVLTGNGRHTYLIVAWSRKLGGSITILIHTGLC